MKADVKPSAKSQMTPSWDLVAKSWKLVQQNIEPLAVIYLLPALLTILATILLGNSLEQHHHVFTGREKIGLYIYGVGLLWTAVNTGPSLVFQLQAVRGKAENIAAIYRQGLPQSLRIIGFYVIFLVLCIIGFLLLFVPGAIIFRRYILTPYYMLDKKISIRQAMKLAADDSVAVKNYIWGTLGVELIFSFIAFGLQAIPLVGAILGQFVTYIVLFIFVLRYQEIQPSTTQKRS